MSDLQVASRMNEAAGGMMEAAELMARAVACLGEIEGMKADNARRAWSQGEFYEPAHDGSDFLAVLERYKIRG